MTDMSDMKVQSRQHYLLLIFHSSNWSWQMRVNSSLWVSVQLCMIHIYLQSVLNHPSAWD